MDMRRNCDFCVSKKVKCDGHPGRECSWCARKGNICIFSPKQKPGPKGSGGSTTAPEPTTPAVISPLLVPCNPPPVLIPTSALSDESDSGDSGVDLGGGSIDLGEGGVDSGVGSMGSGGGGPAAGVGAPSAGGGGIGGAGGGGRAVAAPKKKAKSLGKASSSSPPKRGKGKGRPKKSSSSSSSAGGAREESIGGGGVPASSSPGGYRDEDTGPGAGQQLRMPPLPLCINPGGEPDGPTISTESGGGGGGDTRACSGSDGGGGGTSGSSSGASRGKAAARIGTAVSGAVSMPDGGYVNFFEKSRHRQTKRPSKKRNDPPSRATTDDTAAHRSKRQQRVIDAGVESARDVFECTLASPATPMATPTASVMAPSSPQQQQQRRRRQQRQQQPEAPRPLSRASSDASNDGGGRGGTGGSSGSGPGAGTLQGALRAWAGIAPSLDDSYSNIVTPKGSVFRLSPSPADNPIVSGARRAHADSGAAEPVYMPPWVGGDPLRSLGQGLGDWTPPRDLRLVSSSDILGDFTEMTSDALSGGAGPFGRNML